jgi:hypothetical protein
MSENQEVIDRKPLAPLQFHQQLVEYFQKKETAVWSWAQSEAMRKSNADELRDSMLRLTYRMEPEGHPNIYKNCHAAMAKLNIEAPITLYQAADTAMNAALCFIPGEIHLIFYGPILERLGPDELLALMGHELAHYVLWMAEEGKFYTARRILDLALSYDGSAPSHRETARLMNLYTELFADRGAALVVDAVGPAIAVLVKTMTGISTVDPAAYLRQARELDAVAEKSEGHSHPEVFLRAQALDRWWQQEEQLQHWIDGRLRGPISIESLDLLRQQELTEVTRAFLLRLSREIGVHSDPVQTQIKRLFPNMRDDATVLDLDLIARDKIDDPTRGYFIALIFDCAMADPDIRDEVMLAGAKIAKSMGADELFVAALKRDLKWTKQASDRLMNKAAKAN